MLESRNEIEKFNGQNYDSWKYRIFNVVAEYNFEDCLKHEPEEVAELIIVEGDTAAVQAEKKKNLEIRRTNDKKCRSLLIRSISDSQLEYIKDVRQTAKVIWDTLKNIFERSCATNRIHWLTKIINLKFDESGGKIEEYFLEFDRCIRLYKASGAKIDEIDVVTFLLAALPGSFEAIKITIANLPEDKLTVNEVKTRIMDFMKGRSRTEENRSDENMAFSCKKNYFSKVTCYRCGKQGHIARDCRRSRGNGNGFVRHEKKNYQEAMTAENENAEVPSFSFMCENNKLGTMEKFYWYLDSGATEHMVNDRSLLKDLIRLEKPIEIGVAKGGESMTAEFKGMVTVFANVKNEKICINVENVLCIPELRCNLLSVRKLDEKGFDIIIQKGKVYVKAGKKIIATGESCGNLYLMNLFIESGQSSMYSCGIVRNDLFLWHRRMGHVGKTNLEALLKNNYVSVSEVQETDNRNIFCDSCVEGKLSRKPFSKNPVERSKNILELVHTDLCGPIQPKTYDGNTYFVSFTDDYSRFSVIFLLKNKSDVFHMFKIFEAEATNKFGTGIRKLKIDNSSENIPGVQKLRSDNGTEFKNMEFRNFCEGKGIVQEFTPVHTPECNGVAERLNRTLLEKCRSMLADCGQEKSFWGESLMAATYLKNRTPSRTIGMKLPIEMWSGNQAKLGHIRVFGSLVYFMDKKATRKKARFKIKTRAYDGLCYNRLPDLGFD